MPFFFRKILVDLPPSDEALLEVVEDKWKSGQIPDLRSLFECIAENDPNHVIPDLIMIDMEWRWKSDRQELHFDLCDYEALLRQPLRIVDRARVLCREFGIRNRWGDCITREQLCRRHPELKQLFLKLVEKEIRDIAEWPVITLLRHGNPMASTRLDRPVTAGRQISSAQSPWSVLSCDFSHHLVLCDMLNPQLSRQQLEFRLLPKGIISIQNASRSRAIAIRSNRTVIDAGQTYYCGLGKPIRIHLIAEYDILITRSGDSESR